MTKMIKPKVMDTTSKFSRNTHINKLKAHINRSGASVYDPYKAANAPNSRLFLRGIYSSNIHAVFVIRKIFFSIVDRNITEEFGDCIIKKYNGRLLTAIYLETSEGLNALIYSPNEEIINLDEANFNFSIDGKLVKEIMDFGNSSGIKEIANPNYGAFLSISVAFTDLMERNYQIDVLYIKYINTQRQITNWVLRYFKNAKPEEYNHIEIFSKTYYWEIKIMSELLTNCPDGIVVHDVATNLGQFPLMLSRIGQEHLNGLSIKSIIASDLKIDTAKALIEKTIRQEALKYRTIKIREYDLIKEMDKIPKTDVIIANDVLEHFPEDISLILLKNLWEKTGELLCIHVPFEETPCAAYGHLSSFNSDKLRKWAHLLPGGVFISDNYFEWGATTITEYGYLIMKRE